MAAHRLGDLGDGGAVPAAGDDAGAAGRAAATRSGRRHQIWGAEPLQGQEAVRDRDQRDVVVPAHPAATFEMIQPQGALQFAVILLDGLITNGKFCCTRRVRLRLTWWHRPLRLRRSGLEIDAVLVGACDDPDLDRLPPAQPPPRWRLLLGSGLSVAGALDGRTMRRHPAGGTDGTGGA